MSSEFAPLRNDEIRTFAVDWYRKLDVHAPFEELVTMVAPTGLEMQFPEGTMRGIEDFKHWYETVTHRFFDEVHTVKAVESSIGEQRATVKVVVNWQAKIWDPPAPNSVWLGFDAYQTWVVERSTSTGQLMICRYVVDRLDPMEGSANL